MGNVTACANSERVLFYNGLVTVTYMNIAWLRIKVHDLIGYILSKSEWTEPVLNTVDESLQSLSGTLAEFFNEDGDVSILTDTEKELVAGFRTLPEDKADLALQMIKALNR